MRLDPDDLAAAALQRPGEGAPTVVPDDAEDRATLDAFGRIVAVGRSLDGADTDAAADDPPADLWDRIAARLVDDAEPRAAHLAAVPSGDEAPGAPGGPDLHHVPGPPHHLVDPATGGADVVPLAARRRPWRALAAVAAAVVLLGGLAGIVISQQGGDSAGEFVAGADLELLAGGGSGQAQLVRRDDGLHLVVDVSDLTPAERADFYELWLLAPDGSDPQSIKKFERDSGTIDVVVPAGVDPDRFPVVDISEELRDGDESHSGKSILRGSLQA